MATLDAPGSRAAPVRKPARRRALPIVFGQLVAANLVVAGVVAVVLYLTFQNLTAGYFERLMKEFNISPTKLNSMFVEDVERSLFWGIVLAVAVGIGLSLLLANAIMRPLRKTARASETIAAGDFSARAPEMAGELGTLARSFNAMASSLEMEEARRRRLLRDMSHEIRTPLTNLKGYLEGLNDGVFQGGSEVYTVLIGETDRLNALVDDLAALSAAEQADNRLELAPVDLDQAVNTAIAAHRPATIGGGLEVAFETRGRPRPIRADRKRLDQVLNNALANMMQYADRSGEGGCKASVVADYTGRDAVSLVFDNAAREIEAPDLDVLFDRFYRADPSRTGRASGGHNAGLGLSILRRLVEAHGGTTRAEQRNGRFRLVVTWPLAR